MIHTVIAIFISLAGAAEETTTKPFEKNLIIGHLEFNKACTAQEVLQQGEKLVAADKNFTSMAVAEVDDKQYGLYFRYTTGVAANDNKGLQAVLDKHIGKLKGGCQRGGHSFSSSVILIK